MSAAAEREREKSLSDELLQVPHRTSWVLLLLLLLPSPRRAASVLAPPLLCQKVPPSGGRFT